MPRKRFMPEQVIGKLREAEIPLSKGLTGQQVARKISVIPISLIRCAIIRSSANRLDEFRIQNSLLPSVDGC